MSNQPGHWVYSCHFNKIYKMTHLSSGLALSWVYKKVYHFLLRKYELSRKVNVPYAPFC